MRSQGFSSDGQNSNNSNDSNHGNNSSNSNYSNNCNNGYSRATLLGSSQGLFGMLQGAYRLRLMGRISYSAGVV